MENITLAELSPLSPVECELPIYAGEKRKWISRAGSDEYPLGFKPVDEGGWGTLTPRGNIVAALKMYGGPGVGANAGGVRCANYAGSQIKGVGPSVLAGPGTDKWHRHGALSLQDAVRETLMGELFAIAAPHGAVRALGIADLGFGFATEIGEEKLPGSALRALLYRELSVRVAHFMRSSFLDVGSELAERELLRMRDGIPRLANWLCRYLGEPSFELAVQGLFLMFEPLMNQMAVLRTKRLVHGSLIPSNFCIDGRLLDFTTSTAVSTLQPVMVSLGGLTSQQQHHQVLQALPDLLFYISKYDARCAARREQVQQVSSELTARLNGLHHNYLMGEHLALLGFPVQQAVQLDDGAKAKLLSALVQAIGCGSVQGHLYFGGDEHPMLPQAGVDDLFSLVVAGVQAATGLRLPVSSAYRPEPEAFPAGVVREFVEAFRIAAGSLADAELSGPEQGMAWLIRAMQRNADLTPLYRRHLDGVIHEVCMSGGDFGALIDDTLADWRGVFECPADGRVALGGWLTSESVSLTDDGRLQHGDQRLSPLALLYIEPAARARLRSRWLFDVAAANRLH